MSTHHHMNSCLSLFMAMIFILAGSGAGAQTTSTGPSSLTETYQDWRVSCSGQDQARRCGFSQTLRQQNGQRVLTLELVPSKDGGLTGTLLLPFGIELSRGITLGLDEAAPGPALAVKTCLVAGCVVPFNISAAMAKGYRSSTKLKITTIASDSGNAVPFTLSLNGFAAAQDRATALLR